MRDLEIQELYELNQQRLLKKHRFYESLAMPFVILTNIALTILGTVSIALLFTPSPLLLAFIAVSGFVLDYIMFSHSVKSAFATIFATGIFRDLENYIFTRELENKIIKDYQACNTDDVAQYILPSWAHTLTNETGLYDFKKINTYYDIMDDIRHKRSNKDLLKVIKNYHEKWRLKKQILIAESFFKHPIDSKTLPENTDAYWKKIVDMHSQDWRQSNDPVLQMGAEFEEIKKNTHGEQFTKKSLTLLGLIAATISGAGFACMTLEHIMSVLAIKNVVVLGAVLSCSGLLAAMAGFTWGLLMFKNLHNAVKKNIFRKFYHKLGFHHEQWEELSWSQKSNHLLYCLVKAIPIAAVLTVAIIATALTAEAWFDATIFTISLATDSVNAWLFTGTEFLIYGIMLPVNILFAIKHSIGAVNKCASAVSNSIRSLWNSDALWWEYQWARITLNPWKTIAYTIGGIFTALALAVHFFSEATFGAGEGAHSNSSWPAKMFHHLSRLLNVDPVDAAVAGSGMIEAMVHSDFLMKETGKNFISGFYTVPKRIINTALGRRTDALDGLDDLQELKTLVVNTYADPASAEQANPNLPGGRSANEILDMLHQERYRDIAKHMQEDISHQRHDQYTPLFNQQKLEKTASAKSRSRRSSSKTYPVDNFLEGEDLNVAYGKHGVN